MTPQEEIERTVHAALITPAAGVVWQMIRFGKLTIHVQNGTPVASELNLTLK